MRFAPLALVAVTACAAVHRPRTNIAVIDASAGAARDAYRSTIDTAIERLADRVVARGDRTLDLLLLSGGGQNGAYGTGFLRGWRSRSDAPMPRFDLVTGISAGSLQSPFALLGTESALDTISALFVRDGAQITPTIDYLFWLRRTGGLVNVDRFRATVQKIISDSLRQLLQAEFRDRRQLLIGTTDLDLGVGHVWDLARELDTGAAGLRRAQTILLASTAIPGIFPQVLLDGHLHSDGGTISNVLVPLTLDDYRRLAERLQARSVPGPVNIRVWIIENLWTHAATEVITPSSRTQINTRARGLLFFGQQPQVLEYAATLARAVTTDVAGLRMEMHYVAIPAPLAADPDAKKLFAKSWVAKLDSLGYARARGPAPWDGAVSPYEPAPPGLAADSAASR